MRGVVRTFLLLFLLLQGCQSPTTPQGLKVNVARVVSGQTLEVTTSSEQADTTRVRLVGIDAPDLQQQPWGRAAKESLEAMIGGKPVLLELDVEEKDSFGRRLAYVWQDKVLLNELLVAQGYVLFVPRRTESESQASPNRKYDQRLSRAQESARLMGQGIWNPEKPMRLTPSEFRRQNR